MAVSINGTTPRAGRQSNLRDGVACYRSLVCSIVEVHVAEARSLSGVIVAVDDRAGLMQLDQLGDGRGVLINLGSIVAVEQAKLGEIWALVPAEGVA